MTARQAVCAADEDFGDIPCPLCAAPHSTLVSAFGGNAGESLMRCGHCRSLFHWIKWQGRLPPHPGAHPE